MSTNDRTSSQTALLLHLFEKRGKGSALHRRLRRACRNALDQRLTLKELDLSNCDMDEKGLQQLAAACDDFRVERETAANYAADCAVDTLDLSYNPVGAGAVLSIQTILRALPHVRHLKIAALGISHFQLPLQSLTATLSTSSCAFKCSHCAMRFAVALLKLQPLTSSVRSVLRFADMASKPRTPLSPSLL